MRAQGSKILEERVFCNAEILKQTVKQSLGSDEKLASYLGVHKRTARECRSGRVSLPMSFFVKLQTLNPQLYPIDIADTFWGQRKGGLISGRLPHRHDATTTSRSTELLSRFSERYENVRVDHTFSLDPSAMSVSNPVSLVSTSLLVEHKPALAEFVGRMLGDGSPIIAPTYSASEIESQKRMQSLVEELFGYCPEIKISKGNYRIQLRRICGHTLKLLGIPLGRKSVTNPAVPSFIMECNEPTIWLSFLRGIFDDEAYVSERGIEIGLAVRQLALLSSLDNLSRSRIIDQVAKLLNKLGIQHVRRKGQTYQVGQTNVICWFLRIPRREFRKARDLGLFLLPQKLEKLKGAM